MTQGEQPSPQVSKAHHGDMLKHLDKMETASLQVVVNIEALMEEIKSE